MEHIKCSYEYRVKEWKECRMFFRNKVKLGVFNINENKTGEPIYGLPLVVTYAWAIDNSSIASWGPHCKLSASQLAQRANPEQFRLVNYVELLYWQKDDVFRANYTVRKGIVFA